MPAPGEDPLKIQKQERFCLAMMRGMSQKEAYAAAGYKGNPRALANRVFCYPEVNARLQFLQNRVASTTVNGAIVDRAEVIEGLRANWHSARDGSEVMKNGTGSGVYRPDHASVNKALELLGKSIGVFVDVQREENLDAELEGKTPEELRQTVLALLQGLDPNLQKKLGAQIGLPDDEEPEGEVIEVEATTLQ